MRLRGVVKNVDTSLRMKYIHFKTDGVLTISKFLTGYYKKNKNLTVINVPPLVDTSDGKWKGICKQNNSKEYIFSYTGSPGSGRKDKIDYLVEAFTKIFQNGFTNFRFTIIGITKKQYQKMFKA